MLFDSVQQGPTQKQEMLKHREVSSGTCVNTQPYLCLIICSVLDEALGVTGRGDTKTTNC